MNTIYKSSTSQFINYLNYTNSSKIQPVEDSSDKTSISNILKNNILISEKYIREEILTPLENKQEIFPNSLK